MSNVINKIKDTGVAVKAVAGAAKDSAADAIKEKGIDKKAAQVASKTSDIAHKAGKKAAEVKEKALEIKDDVDNRLHEIDNELEQAITDYNDAYTILNDNGYSLYLQRQRSVDMIGNIEVLINSIANKPKTFDSDIAEIAIHKNGFRTSCEFASDELNAARKSAQGAGAGLAAGTAVASMAPTAAIWVATTFGTASTGTAISTLSGAAATKAALAWLGGGALSAGGGGVAAGNALLALAGPIGWGIAGASLLASIALFSKKKMDINKEKNDEIIAVKNNTEIVKEMNGQLEAILNETKRFRDGLSAKYNDSLNMYAGDYSEFCDEQKEKLMALVNNTRSLSLLLDKTI